MNASAPEAQVRPSSLLNRADVVAQGVGAIGGEVALPSQVGCHAADGGTLVEVLAWAARTGHPAAGAGAAVERVIGAGRQSEGLLRHWTPVSG